jgi:COP9 signalosome complex subunit 2
MMRHYHRLLECIAEGDVSPNAVEKGINGMLERVSSIYQGGARSSVSRSAHNPPMDPHQLALAVYDATLKIFRPSTGSCPNERLWFKTNLKYGQLLYEMNETAKLQQVLRDLKSVPFDDASGGASTQSMEVYALQIQLYSRLKDNKKLREVFTKAMAVRGGIPHPRTIALIQELGGKMHMASKEYENAGKTFFQAFKSYDEAGDPSRLRCLKYLVLASMLHASTINPFDSQEARPYRDDPEITAMTNLVQAFHNNEIQRFERILKQNSGRIMDDEFVREHIEDLLRTIRTQVLRRVIRPYTRISLAAISKELNDIPVKDVENLLVRLILDGILEGQIDQVQRVLLKRAEKGPPPTSDGATIAALSKSTLDASDLRHKKYETMQELAVTLEEIAMKVTNARMKEAPSLRGMIY